MSSKIIIPIAVAISVIVTAGIMYGISFDQQPQVSEIPPPEIIYVDKSVSEYFEGTHDIKKISSQEELKNILEASALLEGYFDNRIFATDMMDDGAVMFEMVESVSEPSSPVSSDVVVKTQSGGIDYSTTNVQVANVDEPDYLKNDSKYVYIVSRNTLSIIDAYPAESAKLLEELENL